MDSFPFAKYHALGNDYLILPPPGWELTPKRARRLCDRHFGPGGDGVLLGPLPSERADCRLRIFNPDGSEAEKSGNGLRIFCRYLWERGMVGEAPFRVETAGGVVRAEVRAGGRSVRVEMGRASFWSTDVPAAGPEREVVLETLTAGDETFRVCAVGLGNPHCVVLRDEISAGLAQSAGPQLETHPLFPNRTNVQFLKALDQERLVIEIWERGAGYTLASGSSACAAAAAAYRLGLCGPHVTVEMPGGELEVEIGAGFQITLTGPVTKVAEGELFPELFE